ncbi:hypothetical protein AX774_g4190 [Zancudomyces culisetae]|uniref:Uncharacterized protein n=1 Tax=Zancudomyces culisetae TaxID=1213189 RepID=A0A1R1PMX8_ZANCU|nr:hypothetical protein AX774_g6699 [Zancudomyces culisetae]OMH82326.1 hypothetical protein AX774_g4190 [Zancudomyces culisetae]|eukprot:OMH79871.1 hypothetical protein AX774_g6699 [Zancudomyces culisetae]
MGVEPKMMRRMGQNGVKTEKQLGTEPLASFEKQIDAFEIYNYSSGSEELDNDESYHTARDLAARRSTYDREAEDRAFTEMEELVKKMKKQNGS